MYIIIVTPIFVPYRHTPPRLFTQQTNTTPNMPTPADTIIVVLLVLLPILYVYRDSLPLIGKSALNKASSSSSTSNGAVGLAGKKKREEQGDPRDWLEQMKKAVSCGPPPPVSLVIAT